MPDFKKQDGTIQSVHESRVDDFKAAFPNAVLVTEEVNAGKEIPSQETESAAVEENVALEPTATELVSEDTSLDSQKIKTPEVKTGTVADTEYIPPVVTSKESQKIIDDFNKISNVDVEFENKKATVEKINRFKKDQFKTAEREEYNLYKQTGKVQPVVLEDVEVKQKIENNRRDFMEDIAQDKRVQLLNQETKLRDALLNTTNELTSKINSNINAVNDIIFQYEESVKQGVPYSEEEYNIAKQKSQEIIKSTKQMESDLLRDLAILNKKNEFIDSFKRSYSNIDQLENVLKTTATDIALGLAVPLDMLKSEEGKEKSYTKDLLNYRQKLQKESAEGLPKAIPVESISSLKDLVNWGSDAFVNFVPSGAMAFTGPAAPYLFGASGFGGRIAQFELDALEAKNQIPKLQELHSKSDDPLEKAEIQKEIDKYNEALNVSDLKKLTVSGIYGAAEVGTEMLTTVRLVKDLKSANTLFYKEGFVPAFKQAIKDIPTGGVLEGGGEGLNSIIGNIADITILNEDKNAFEGVTESVAQGFFIGNGFKIANAGNLARAYAYDVITDKQNKQEIESILKEVNNLSNAFAENTDINTKAEAARVIRSKIKELSLNQDFTASQFLKLSEADQKAVFEADRQSKKVNERWKKIANSNLDETSKDLIRKDLESEFNSYQDKKISLLRKSNINTELQQPKGLQEGDFYRGYKIHQVNDAAVKRNNSLNKLANKVVNVLSVEAETINDFINSDETLLTLNDRSVITKEEAQQINTIWENGADGGFDPISKNQYTIIERAAVNNPSTALHEYFHAMAAEKGFTEEQFNKIKDDYIALLNTKKENGELTEKQYNEIFSRLPVYDGKAEQAEELINLTADAVNLQIIKETDFDFLQRFANNVKSIVGSIIGKDEADNFNINTAEDAWNMVQTFSKDVLSSAPQKQIIGTQPKEEEEPAVKQAEAVIKESRSEEASNKVQEIYEQKGINGALDIIDQFKPITNKIVDQRKNAPGFDRQLLTDEIETGAGGILDLIQAYDPASNVPLAAYINKYLPVRSITASRRVLGEEFTDDITESVQVAAEAAPETEIEVAETKPAERLIEVKKQILSEPNQKELEDIVAEKLPELTPDQFTFKTLPNWAKQTLAKEIDIPVKKFEGSSNFTQAELDRVTSFIENNIDTVRKALPDAAVLEGAPVSEGLIGTATGVPNNLLKDANLYTRLERGTKKAGLVPFQKNKGIDNTSILKAIGIVDGKRTAGPRDKQAQTAKGLINVLAKFVTNQEVRKQADLTPQQKTDIETGKGSRLLYSLNTKGDGTWVQNPLNPLDNKSKIYSFQVGQVDYEITTFQQSFENNGYDFELFDGNELEEKFIKDIADDNNSLGLVFADVDTGSTQITGVAEDGLTNQFKVFGIVANSTIDLIKKEKLNSITFSAKESSRKRLYEAMIQKFKKELGWESYNYELEDGESEAYIVYDPKVFINPETAVTTEKESRLLYSFNTKGDGTWVSDLLNPLTPNNKFYNFNVANQTFRISLFENDDFDYEILEQTEGIKDDAFVNDPKSMAIAFSDELGSTEITGRVGAKDSIKVFSIVANSVLDIIKQDNLNSITFTGKEPSRQRLYESMVQKFQKELGWKSYTFELEGETVFIVYNPKVFKSKETAVTTEKESRILFSKNYKANPPTPKEITELAKLLNVRSTQKSVGLALAKINNKIEANPSLYEEYDDIYKTYLEPYILFKEKARKLAWPEAEKQVEKVLLNLAQQGLPISDVKINLNSLKIDIEFKLDGKRFFVEVKKNENAQLGSIFLRENIKGGLFTNNSADKAFIDEIIKKDINRNSLIDRIIKNHGTNEIVYRTKGNEKTIIVPFDYYQEANRQLNTNQKESKFEMPIELVSSMYINKAKRAEKKDKILVNGNFISFGDLGSFVIGPNNLNAPLPNLAQKNAAVTVRTRWKYYDRNDVNFNGEYKRAVSLFRVAVPTLTKETKEILSNTDALSFQNEDQARAIFKFSLSKSKAATKNNLELPKSQRLPKGSTNEQVLAKMQELDNEANEARIKYSKSQNLDDAFNDIIEAKTGIETYKRFSPAKAQVRGASKGKFNFFIPPSAEDFVGLLYKTLAKGKLGDNQMQWYKDNLLDPYARAMNDISSARVAMFNDYKQLKEDLKVIPKDLKKKSVDEYTREQAVRVYIWNKQNNNIPGLFKTDQKELSDYVNKDPELKLFAEQIIAIQKGDVYAAPKEGWLAGSITTDFLEGLNTTKRKKYLEQWQTNVDEIFSEVNLNKLEAAFGKPYRNALENILRRMKTGRNKPFESDSLAGRFTNWLNNSVGAIMFFNTRSAVLQLLSSINFVNFTDNNPLMAGVAFANQPQYWKDFKFLFNSDFLKERRGGLRFNVSESEIADMAKKAGARGVLSKILQAGFLPTQAADSFAIASGGATFYRNRINTYIKQEFTESEAQEKAFTDFRELAEESQQSSRPDRISAQQAGPLGRTILAFANTPAQYARLTKKAASDLINGRGDAKTNITKLAYYGFVQNLMFTYLQQAVFAIAFGDSEEDEKEKEKKYLDVANSMADGFLRGIGISGAIISTIKNALIKIIKESEKKRPDYAETVVMQLLGISPPVQSKAQKIRSALKSYEWNKKEMLEKGFSLDNPAYLAGANVISASTNLPLDRIVKKVDNIKNSTRDDITSLNRIMLLAGWSDWQLGIQKPKKEVEKKVARGSKRGNSRSSNRLSNRR